jgi:hypothetical protein
MGSASEVVQTLRALAARYAVGVDRRDRSYFLGAFHEDATLVADQQGGRHPQPQNRMHGHDEIGRVIDWIAAYPKTFHMIGQCRYDLEERAATGEVYCQANHYVVTDKGNVNRVMYIRYQDQYRTVDDGIWRIDSRQVLVDWTETHPADPLINRSGGVG